MGSPAHLSLPEQGSSSLVSSPGGSIYSPLGTESSSMTSSSFSLPDSSSSFPQRDSTEIESRAQITNHQKLQDFPEVHKEVAGHNKKCTCKKPLRESKRTLMGSCKSCKMDFSMRKACCRCAGGFAADCTALCCCPCAIFSLLAFMLVELPSALATKMITRLKKRLSVKDTATTTSSTHADDAQSVFTPTRSHRDACKGAGEVQAVHIFRFDTENLLKHFDAEHVGFGCLSQKRE